MRTHRLLAALLAILSVSPVASAAPATNAFTFQGRLLESDRPNTTTVQATFQLFASPTGTDDPVSLPITRTINFDPQGRFTVLLDFGQDFNGFPIFNGDQRFMQIVILDPPGGIEEDFPLSPRTPLTAAPLAAYALNARIPSLAEITDGRLESTDGDGSLAITLFDRDLGLTIRESGQQGALFTHTGIAATESFAIATSVGDLSLTAQAGNAIISSPQENIHLDAPQGNIGLLSGGTFSVNAGGGSVLTIGQSGFTLDAIDIDMDADTSIDLSGIAVNISSGGVLKLTAALNQIVGPLVIQNHQFNADSVQLGGTLLVTGNAFKPGGGPWSTLSDARLKRNVVPLRGSLGTLERLRPVRFEYQPGHPLAASGEFRGFIAQEVVKVLPEWVTVDEAGVLLLSPIGFEALTVDAIQELKRDHERELDRLTKENKEMKDRIEQLERAVRRISDRPD